MTDQSRTAVRIRSTLRFAYADPPYPGQAKLYRDHPDYAGEVDHAGLIARLERDYIDGWALSTSVPALSDVLAMCKKNVRLCVWFRGPMPRPPARIMPTWEPVIVHVPHWRQRYKGDFVWDSRNHVANMVGQSFTGQKPPAFVRWLFDLLGARPGDELDDLFPGSGAVGREWAAVSAQTNLFMGVPA